MRVPFPIRVMRFAIAFAVILGITVFYRKAVPANATTVALTFLLAILVVSSAWGIVVSVFMSIVAMLAFNYYFLQPVGTFTIADPQNWVALFAFLVVSVFGSHLSTRARQQAEEARARRRDIEKLYTFSQAGIRQRHPVA
jgi:two-component system sensor histidine kinase KdpD